MKKTFWFFICIWIYLNILCVKSDEKKCELAAFLENSMGTKRMMIDSGPVSNFTFVSCEESANNCEKMAEEEVIAGTNGGNFSLPVNDEGYTVGDILCDKADQVEENTHNKIIRIYWRLCRSPWKPTSFRMPEPLCCRDGLYVPCSKYKSEF